MREGDSGMIDSSRRHVNANGKRSLKGAVLYTVLALGLSLLYWAIAVSGGGRFPFGQAFWGIARSYTCAVAAVVAAAYLGGFGGLKTLWATVTAWGFSWKLYVLSIFGFLVIILGGTCAAAVFGQETVTIGKATPASIAILFIYTLLADGPLGEEIGWRGFLLPTLLRNMSPVRASLVLGVIWWLWHIPLYKADGPRFHLSGTFLILYLITELSLSLIFTWFFLRAGRSAFIAILVHTGNNFTWMMQRIVFPHAASPEIAFRLITAGLAIAAGIDLTRRYTTSRMEAASLDSLAAGPSPS